MDIFNATDEQIMSAMEPPADATTQTPATTVVDTTTENAPSPAEGDDDSGAEGQTESNGTEAQEDEVDPDKQTENTEVDTQDQIDLKRILAPFNANGREMKVDNVDEAIRLMQMGAGFNKKMTALKPHLKLVKMLANNDLLDEAKLNHLIDISKRNPDAISKLLAEGNIDPLNLTTGNEYKPNTYTVTDSELELDNVLSDLKESPHYAQTLDVVANKLDGTSKQLLISQPEIMRVLHDQIGNGIYARVTAQVERSRMLGELSGLSDIEAYKITGDKMNDAGAFNDLAKPKSPPASKAPPTTLPPKTLSAEDAALKSRKLAASPTKAAPGKKQDLGNFNPLTATDAEIAAMTLDKFL